MISLTEMKLESNSKIRIDFGGGNLSSDGGLLLMKEFLSKIGFERLAAAKFKTTDKAKRVHTDAFPLKVIHMLPGFNPCILRRVFDLGLIEQIEKAGPQSNLRSIGSVSVHGSCQVPQHVPSPITSFTNNDETDDRIYSQPENSFLSRKIISDNMLLFAYWMGTYQLDHGLSVIEAVGNDRQLSIAPLTVRGDASVIPEDMHRSYF